ncbi:MAG: DUF6079 family protein [Ktedonobacteraceae bacterium]
MPNVDELFAVRKSLHEICGVPDNIISVYTLEQHIWAETGEASNKASRAQRIPAGQTVEEFQINPVRSFLNDILRLMSAPYRPERRDEQIGQGYWIQAEFGSGKSHLLCFLAALALGDEDIWELVRQKEAKAGRGRRESLYQFWEEGLKTKSSNGKKGIFVIAKTLVGTGGGTVGKAGDTQRLANYILDAAREQLILELGKNISLYPVEILADRFMSEDYARYREDLKKFLKDRRFFEEDELEVVDDFIRELQSNKAPEYKRSCGEKLWRFYDEYLKMRPHLETETEEVLKHMVEAIMAEGYSGVLLILDEVSLFMKNRNEEQRVDDEQTLVVLANRLAKVHNLPIWTVGAAQQAIESKMGVKNIIANDRLKLVLLLSEDDNGYYDIVLARVREIIDPDAINNYYLYYKHGFTWPATVGEEQFRHFFPFHKPALEVLRAITGELTTARSAIHFMHQTLKHQIKAGGDHLISLWQLFDEAVNYEEDPSGVNAGLASIKTKREMDYKAYEVCKRQIDGQTKGPLKVYREKAIKTLQTLFLYHVARTRQQGITPEEIANSILIERAVDATPQENIDHYQSLAESLRKELRQVVSILDESNTARYRFDPVFTGIDPRHEFEKARNEAESNERMRQEAWDFLLGLAKWPVKTRQMTIDLSNGTTSLFSGIAGTLVPYAKEQTFEIEWQRRLITGTICMRDLLRPGTEQFLLPLRSDETDHDFAVYVSTGPTSAPQIERLLKVRSDPRIIVWTPASFTDDERSRLNELAAYRKLIRDCEGKDNEDAVTIIQWVANSLQAEIGKIVKVIDSAYARGRIESLDIKNMEFHVAGDIKGILTPIINQVLNAVYESRDIIFDHPFTFRKEDAVKVINGIAKTGEIPRHAKPTGDVSAAQNFGYALGIMKKGTEYKLDISGNRFVQDIYAFIDQKLVNEGQTMSIETLYKNFMGISTPISYGLSRRIVQLYLLCLVQTGKIRIGLNARVGLPFSYIDYQTIKEIDFSGRILDALAEVQKMEQPKNWEVFRPFAEALLGKSIPPTHDDTVIAPFRVELRILFSKEKEETSRIAGNASKLFGDLHASNPYEKVLKQCERFFQAADIENIDDALYHLKEVFGYSAFDTGLAEEADIHDLKQRMKHYRDMQQFLTYGTELRTAYQYCTHHLPDSRDLATTLKIQQELAEKLQHLQPYIDSEVKLRTELIGSSPHGVGEPYTLQALIADYKIVYITLHNNILSKLENHRMALQGLLGGTELAALKILENISALQPAVSDTIEDRLKKLLDEIFTCPSPSQTSIEAGLEREPVHICGLSFENYNDFLQKAEQAEEEGKRLFNEAIEHKMEIFLNPAIQERLRQGQDKPTIAALLQCRTAGDLWAYLTGQGQETLSIVEAINHYLKRIVVKKVRIADFKPPTTTIEKEQIVDVAIAFQAFLEEQLQGIAADSAADTLPMLQVE